MSDAYACGTPAYREQPSAKGSHAPAGHPSPVAQQASQSQRHAARATRARLNAISRPLQPRTPGEHAPPSRRSHLDRQQPRGLPGQHAIRQSRERRYRYDLPGAAGLTGELPGCQPAATVAPLGRHARPGPRLRLSLAGRETETKAIVVEVNPFRSSGQIRLRSWARESAISMAKDVVPFVMDL